MKRTVFYIIAAFMLFTGCNQAKEVQYNVNPDSVFGKHYTAKDFGIWHLLDFGDSKYQDPVGEAWMNLPEENWSAWDNQNGLQLPASDTAAFMQSLRELTLPRSPEGSKLIPCWILKTDSLGDRFQFNFLYGNKSGKPIIDGTHVKKCFVEKSDFSEGYEVRFRFDMKTADFWQKFTAEHVGERIAMMLGTDLLLSDPQIMCEIAGGACSVFGPTEEECYALATILQSAK